MDGAGKTIRVLYKRVSKMNESALGSVPILKGFGDAHIATHFRKFGINAKSIVLTPVEGRDFVVQWQGFIKGMEALKERFGWLRNEQQRQCERLVQRLVKELEEEIAAGKETVARASRNPKTPIFSSFGPLTFGLTRASHSSAPSASNELLLPSGNPADVMFKLGDREFTRGELLVVDPTRLVTLYQKLSDQMSHEALTADEDIAAVNAVIEEAGSEADWQQQEGMRRLVFN